MRSDWIIMTSWPREKQANIDRHLYNITNISFGVFGKYSSIYQFNVQKIQAQRKSTKPGWINADFFHGLPKVEPYIY